MITPGQIRAARGLARWSQGDLGARADVSVPTIANIELEHQQPSTATLEKLERAFIMGGIEFTNDGGVRPRSNPIQFLEGKSGLKLVMDAIYAHCSAAPTSVVRVNNIRIKQYRDALGDFIVENRARMMAIPNMTPWKTLMHEDDIGGDVPPMATLRVLNRTLFGSVGQYAFGDHVALVDFADGCKITLIENVRLKESWDLVFDALWENAAIIGSA